MILAVAVAAALVLGRQPAQSSIDLVEHEARRHRIPVSLVLAVCGLESGMNTRGGILCGCHVLDPATRRINRDPAVQARCAAGSLAHGRRLCGSWAGSLRRYRYGGSCPLADPRAYVHRVGALQRRVSGHAGESPVAGLL